MSTNTTAAGQGRIVVGVDGSAAGDEALRWAVRLAPTLGATVQVVSAWELEFEPASRDIVDETIRRVFGGAAPDGLDVLVKAGNPARLLLDAGRGATMIVVGSRGVGGFTGLLLGSVSRSVAEHATCPVMIVRQPQPTQE